MQHHLVGGDGGRAEPRGDRACGDEARLERQRAQHQVAAHHHLRPQHRRSHPQRDLLDQQRPAEQRRGQPLTDHVGHRRAGQPQLGHAQPAVHQQRAQHRRHREAEHDVAQRPDGVLHAAHPPVARRGTRIAGAAEHGDPHPRQRRVGDLTAGGERGHQRARGQSGRRRRWPCRCASASQVACTPSTDGRAACRLPRRTAPPGPSCRTTGTSAASSAPPRISAPIARPARLSAPRRPTTARSNSR